MAERFTFSVAYEPATLKSAVRAHLLRALWTRQRRATSVAGAALILAVVLPPALNGFDAQGLMAGLATLVVVGVAFGVWIYVSGAGAKLARARVPRAVFVISDDAIEMNTDQGSGRFAWESIRQIWKFRRYWLLMIDLNRFVTLPLADAPAGALQFLDEKIQPRPFKAA